MYKAGSLYSSFRLIITPCLKLLKNAENGDVLSNDKLEFIKTSLRVLYGKIEKELREVPDGKVS